VEPAENQSSTGADKSILITTARSSFLFAQIHDRDFVVQKISELLAKSKLNYMYVYITVCYFLADMKYKYKNCTLVHANCNLVTCFIIELKITYVRRIPRIVTLATAKK